MKRYKLTLVKSYQVEVEATHEAAAAHFTELYTSDIHSLISENGKVFFSINEIECTMKEVIEVEKIFK